MGVVEFQQYPLGLATEILGAPVEAGVKTECNALQLPRNLPPVLKRAGSTLQVGASVIRHQLTTRRLLLQPLTRPFSLTLHSLNLDRSGRKQSAQEAGGRSKSDSHDSGIGYVFARAA
jgi:hypothetical protein